MNALLSLVIEYCKKNLILDKLRIWKFRPDPNETKTPDPAPLITVNTTGELLKEMIQQKKQLLLGRLASLDSG